MITLLIILYFLPIVLYLDLLCGLQQERNELEVEKIIVEKRLEEMEKEIRILKQDSYINKNGFEGGIE